MKARRNKQSVVYKAYEHLSHFYPEAHSDWLPQALSLHLTLTHTHTHTHQFAAGVRWSRLTAGPGPGPQSGYKASSQVGVSVHLTVSSNSLRRWRWAVCRKCPSVATITFHIGANNILAPGATLQTEYVLFNLTMRVKNKNNGMLRAWKTWSYFLKLFLSGTGHKHETVKDDEHESKCAREITCFHVFADKEHWNGRANNIFVHQRFY